MAELATFNFSKTDTQIKNGAYETHYFEPNVYLDLDYDPMLEKFWVEYTAHCNSFGWGYETIADAQKAFINIINSYPDVKVN